MPFKKIYAAAISWACAAAVVSVTAYSGASFLKEITPRRIPQQNESVTAEFSAESLQKYLNERARTLADLDKFDGIAHNARATYLTRPSVQLRGVIIHGDRTFAVVAIEGEKQTAVMQVGDEIAGVKILEIDANGINCEWREEKFFVPLN